jgi:hypothetical protein
MQKVGGLAATLGVLLALVAGVIVLPETVPVAAILVVLGVIAGISTPQDGAVRVYVAVLAFPVVGTALGNIPAVGEYLSAIFINLGFAAAGIAATLMAMRVFEMAKGGVTGLTAK